MLYWANQYSICCFVDNNQYPQGFSCMLAVGATHILNTTENALPQLQAFINEHQDWCFGHITYDVKKETLGSSNTLPDYVGFEYLSFFIPEIVVQLHENTITIGTFSNHEWIARTLFDTHVAPTLNQPVNNIKSRYNKQEYIETVLRLQKHMARGDCYELNFCQEFYAESVAVDNPVALFESLMQESPVPFASYYKLNHNYAFCASPERFLKKEQNTLISQPIKGTIKRAKNPEEDEELAKELRNSAKEKAENVMVVDLVRNDMSQVCHRATVKVSELMGLYAFPQVYQLISTVEGQVNAGREGIQDILNACFPMGSMTGAPKRNVVSLIEKYEKSRRGLYSGSIGYITPDGDMDLNVVIRSILYNQHAGYLSFQVGSAITWYADPEQEYEECLLKASAIKKVLLGNTHTPPSGTE